MFYKKSIVKKVYKFYLKGIGIDIIANHLELSENGVNEIIDYINEIYH